MDLEKAIELCQSATNVYVYHWRNDYDMVICVGKIKDISRTTTMSLITGDLIFLDDEQKEYCTNDDISVYIPEQTIISGYGYDHQSFYNEKRHYFDIDDVFIDYESAMNNLFDK